MKSGVRLVIRSLVNLESSPRGRLLHCFIADQKFILCNRFQNDVAACQLSTTMCISEVRTHVLHGNTSVAGLLESECAIR